VTIRPQELVHNYGPTRNGVVAENTDFACSSVIWEGGTEGVLGYFEAGAGQCMQVFIGEPGSGLIYNGVRLPSSQLRSQPSLDT
jgi:hypothetical protein